MIEVAVTPMEAGKKMHRLLRQMLPGMPLSGVHKMIRTGRVKRNGKKAKAEDVAQAGDVLHLYMAEEDYEQVRKRAKKFSGVSSDISILHEDKHILVVNKPAGLLVHGAEGEHKDTLVNRVLAYLYRHGEETPMFTPAPVHRLDRNTSGIVLFAKDGESSRRLSQSIADHEVGKWYLALVTGKPPAQGRIEAALGRREDELKTVVTKEGKESVTKYQVLGTAGNVSLVRVDLISGRTHQIRAHFAHVGHALVGDPKYARDRNANNTTHQWLHAAWLQLPDGRTFTAPIPEDFQRVLLRYGFSERQLQQVADWRP